MNFIHFHFYNTLIKKKQSSAAVIGKTKQGKL